MSELSTVAIKDGHRGHPHHHHAPDLRTLVAGGGNTLDAERADRISRLAGLERVTAVRQSSSSSIPPGASAANPQGYFDTLVPPNFAKERSTVGSASATGSVGGGMSDQFDHTDKFSEDMDTSSMGGFSDEGNASLVGFGEGASSTVSGPVSTAYGDRTPQRQGIGAPYQPKAGFSNYMRDSTPHNVTGSPTTSAKEPKIIDGMTYDSGIVDTAHTGPLPVAEDRE